MLNSPATYENDGWGCRSFPTPMFVHFATPQHWVALDFAGIVVIRLYFEGEFMSAHLFFGSGSPEDFGGLLSSSPFDEVEFIDSFGGSVNADDIYFGPRLPGDANGDAQVDVADLIDVILGWGPCAAAGPCPPDVTEDGEVDVADVLEVVLGWGG